MPDYRVTFKDLCDDETHWSVVNAPDAETAVDLARYQIAENIAYDEAGLDEHSEDPLIEDVVQAVANDLELVSVVNHAE